MKEVFKTYSFRPESLALIDHANIIIEEYLRLGLKLTLRQLYYQFVARDLLPNSQSSYKKLGIIISKARLSGLVDWEVLEDRTRFLRGRNNWDSPLDMIKTMTNQYTIPMWENQEYYLEVWIEKDALIGVIESVCRSNDVDYFACRGYVSQSEQYEAGRRLSYASATGKKPLVIHLGDHDPSGMDMTRDNEDRLSMFAETFIPVDRIALNFDQITKYNPPPNPAKLTDSRIANYRSRWGNQSWELDALEPTVLQNLIQDTIDTYKDPDKWAESESKHRDHLEHLDSIIENLEKEY